MSEEVMETPEGSVPEGEGFGKPWVPQPGITFLMAGAFTRSIIDLTSGEPVGMVGIDIEGRWNHGAQDTLSIIVSTEVAAEWAEHLQTAVLEAPEDAKRVKESGLS